LSQINSSIEMSYTLSLRPGKNSQGEQGKERSDIIVAFSNGIELQAKKRPLEIGCSIGPLNEGWREH